MNPPFESDLNFPRRIATKRLLLRTWSREDAKSARAAIDESDAHLRPWIPFMKNEPRSLDETRSWIEQHIAHFEKSEHFRYVIRDAEDTEFFGEVMLLGRAGESALELGYWLHVRSIGRGYALEACRALCALAFEQPSILCLEAVCAPGNVASNKLAEKLGFTLTDRNLRDGDQELNLWRLQRASG